MVLLDDFLIVNCELGNCELKMFVLSELFFVGEVCIYEVYGYDSIDGRCVAAG
jgi:hypothetical protein